MGRTNKPRTLAEQVEVASETRNERKSRDIKTQDLYQSGSTMVNLACSDHSRGAFKLGSIVTLPGSSASGKSFLGETALAEGIYDRRFDKYSFIRDDAEAAYNFDTDYLFGPKVAKRVLKPPFGLSNTIQMFESNILDVVKKKDTSVIYLLDSLDALSSDEELEKEMRKALAMAKSEEAAKKIAGSYGTEKAKIMGQTLRMINQELVRTRSLLIIVQQIRQNINAGPFSSPWRTSGGEAPFFWSEHQVWLNKAGTLKLKDRKVGTKVEAKIKKNKLNGKLREVAFDIWYSYGIDDIRSMLDFLLMEKYIKKGDSSILSIDELGISGTYLANGTGTILTKIEEEGKVPELRKLTERAWNEIESSLLLDRPPRF